jgi:TonB family protein
VESKHKMVNPLEDSDDDPDGMQVEGTLGQLDQGAIDSGLRPQMATVTRCFDERARRLPYLSGRVALKFRIARDGAIKTLTLTESSLGSYTVERCILQAMNMARFERPKGGEAEFTYSLEFSGKVTPLVWDPGMVKEEIEKKIEDLLVFKEEGVENTLTAPKGLVVTFYVNRRGRVLCAGMTAQEAIDEEFAERFITNLKKIKFVEPDERYAKVTYTW